MRLRTVVGVVADEREAVGRLVGAELERAGRDRERLVQAVVPALLDPLRVLLDDVRRNDAAEQAPPVGELLLEDDRDGLVAVRAGDRLDVLVAGGGGDVELLVGAVLRLPHQRKVLDVDGHAVGPLRLRLDLVGDGLGIGLGELGGDQEVLVELHREVRVDAEGGREHCLVDVDNGGAVVLRGVLVEAGGLLVGAVGQRAAVLDGHRRWRGVLFGVAGAAGASAAGGGAERGDEQDGQDPSGGAVCAHGAPLEGC